MHLGSTVHNQPCQPKPSGDWPQEGKTLRKEGKKKKKISLICVILVCVRGRAPGPTPQPGDAPPQSHLLLPGNVPPRLLWPPSIAGEGHHREEGATVAGCWHGLPLPVLCFRILHRYPELWGDTAALQSLKPSTRS